jgi:hypothetical protein
MAGIQNTGCPLFVCGASTVAQMNGGVFLWSFLLEVVDSGVIMMASTVSAGEKARVFYLEAALFRRGLRADFSVWTMRQLALEPPAFSI